MKRLYVAIALVAGMSVLMSSASFAQSPHKKHHRHHHHRHHVVKPH